MSVFGKILVGLVLLLSIFGIYVNRDVIKACNDRGGVLTKNGCIDSSNWMSREEYPEEALQ
jgi:hypothetical protein